MDIATALRAFVRTVERGSITAAARDLGVSQPAITKHLRNLEREVGARLLERSARGVRTTPLGQNLFDSSRPALATIEAALEGVSRDMGEIDGLLRIHAPSCIGAKHVHRIVTEFQNRYPRVTVDLFLEDRRVDIVYDNFDLSLKYGRPDGQDIIIRRIGHIRRILVASPRYRKRAGDIKTLKQLGEAQLITTAAVLSPRDSLKLIRRGKTIEVPVKPVIRTNNAQVLESTLLSGRAVGPIQEMLVAKELAAGQLIRILPEYEVESTDVFLPSVTCGRPCAPLLTSSCRLYEASKASKPPIDQTPMILPGPSSPLPAVIGSRMRNPAGICVRPNELQMHARQAEQFTITIIKGAADGFATAKELAAHGSG